MDGLCNDHVDDSNRDRIFHHSAWIDSNFVIEYVLKVFRDMSFKSQNKRWCFFVGILIGIKLTE